MLLVMMLIISVVVVATSAIFTGLLVQYRTQDLIESADVRLLAAVELTREVLGPDYHDHINDETSVSKERFRQIVARNDDLCRRLNPQYLWSVLLVKDRLVFTSATHSDLNDPNSHCASFFETHRDPEAFAPAMQQELKPSYSSFKNEWGEGRQILIPRKDARGRTYIFGASVQLTELNVMVLRTALISIGIGLAVICGAILIALMLSRSFIAPITSLTEAADRMATGNLDVPLPLFRTSELQSLSKSLDKMRLELKTQLTLLRASKARLSKSQEIAHLGSWELDHTTNRLIWSDETYRIFGLQTQKFTVTYGAFLQAVHPDDRAAVDEAYCASVRQGLGSYEIKHRVIRKSTGEMRYVQEKCEHIKDASGKIVLSVGMVHDITERNKAEDELKAKNDELMHFNYAVSHDLKSPLVTIKTFLGYLEQDMEKADQEHVAQDLGFIHTAADKMNALLEELLDLSRIGRVVKPPVEAPLHDIVQETLALVAGRIDKSGARITVTKNPVMLYGDRVRLVELFQNLVDNAAKFMGDQSEPLIEIGAKTKDGETVCFVRDNGMGINPRYQDKLFGLFEKLNPEMEGTGMGLALVKRIVEVHGGTIRVESEGLGKGACFWFTLPGK